jgi:Protein of unknown function (DUF2917)
LYNLVSEKVLQSHLHCLRVSVKSGFRIQWRLAHKSRRNMLSNKDSVTLSKASRVNLRQVEAVCLTLKSGNLFKLRSVQDLTIVCTGGCIWVTVEGKPWDIVLYGGDSFKIERRLLTLVTAMEDSDFKTF